MECFVSSCVFEKRLVDIYELERVLAELRLCSGLVDHVASCGRLSLGWSENARRVQGLEERGSVSGREDPHQRNAEADGQIGLHIVMRKVAPSSSQSGHVCGGEARRIEIGRRTA